MRLLPFFKELEFGEFNTYKLAYIFLYKLGEPGYFMELKGGHCMKCTYCVREHKAASLSVNGQWSTTSVTSEHLSLIRCQSLNKVAKSLSRNLDGPIIYANSAAYPAPDSHQHITITLAHSEKMPCYRQRGQGQACSQVRSSSQWPWFGTGGFYRDLSTHLSALWTQDLSPGKQQPS